MSTKSSTSSPAAAEATDSLLSRTLLGPILFVSFIFSLFFVDTQTSSGIFKSSDRRRSSPERTGERYYHSHQRKLAKREVDDAFALRGRVIAGMCVASAIGLAGIGWCLAKAWHLWGVNFHAGPVVPE